MSYFVQGFPYNKFRALPNRQAASPAVQEWPMNQTADRTHTTWQPETKLAPQCFIHLVADAEPAERPRRAVPRGFLHEQRYMIAGLLVLAVLTAGLLLMLRLDW